MSTFKTIASRDRTLAVEISGSGEAVIMLHGLGGTMNIWHAQAQELSKRFTVIRVDLAGSGRSSTPAHLSIGGWVDDLAAIMRFEGIARASIVAHSLGTLIAQHFAAEHPDCISRLALFAVNKAPPDERRQALRDRAAKVRQDGLRSIVDGVVSAGTAPSARADNPLLEPFIRELVLRQSAEGYALSCEAIANSVAADLSRIRCPTLLVAGVEDAISPPKLAESVAPALANAKLATIEKCGHWLPVERPRDVMQRLGEFL